jgi:uncharacterized membrane protein YeaQ/YmgE (transglycosylase-associated protein family)
MEFILLILVFCVSGAIVGGLARLALPGPDPMSLGETILVGILGSLLAGLIVQLLFGRAPSVLAAVLGATAIVALIRRTRARSGSGPTY